MTSNLLARFRVAPADFPEPTLYVRTPGGVLDDRGLHLKKDETATFDTTFAVFPAGRWCRLTNVADVLARVDATGRVRVDLVSHTDGVDTVVASSEHGEPVTCADLRGLNAESLYVSVTALEDNVTVRGGEWRTTSPVLRDVRLGVAITTFNRQEYVLRTIEIGRAHV